MKSGLTIRGRARSCCESNELALWGSYSSNFLLTELVGFRCVATHEERASKPHCAHESIPPNRGQFLFIFLRRHAQKCEPLLQANIRQGSEKRFNNNESNELALGRSAYSERPRACNSFVARCDAIV